ncbi:MAG: COG4280 domain-containing protein, partial [Hyphomicrobiales bacterium]
TPFLAAFLGSFVECVEAMTIVLAVGTVRGWRSALAGLAAGLIVLTLLTAALGPAIAHAPVELIQISVGVLLILFGMAWLRKAILRAAGIIAFHDEEAAFASETRLLRGLPPTLSALDAVAVAASFKSVLLEGVEVVFIVVAVGVRQGHLASAAQGAALAAALVLALALVVRHPLSLVPENLLKFGVGVLISAFGLFWLGEGLGVAWPGGDLFIPAIAAALLASALFLVVLARWAATPLIRGQVS